MNNKIQESLWYKVRITERLTPYSISIPVEDSVLKLVRSRIEYPVRNEIYISVQNLIHFSVCRKYE
jgi:hypothetical protein